MAQPEQQAREEIDRLLKAAGWRVCDLAEPNIHAARGLAIREFPLETGFGLADYLLYVDGKAAGIIEAKKQGNTLSGVEFQSGRYAQGLPAALPAWRRPLPFLYESTGIETHSGNRSGCLRCGNGGKSPCHQRRLLCLWLFGLMRGTLANLMFAYPGKNKLAEVCIYCYFANCG